MNNGFLNCKLCLLAVYWLICSLIDNILISIKRNIDIDYTDCTNKLN